MNWSNAAQSIALLVLLTSCRDEAPADEAAATPAQTQASAASPAASTAADADKVKVKSPDGKELVTIREQGDGKIKIEFFADGQQRVMRGEMKDSGKRKYEIEGGPVIAEVKPSDSGFKVRLPDGKLLWKVKIADEKTKISDNEENNNPFVLDVKEADRVKVLAPGDKEVGKVKFYRSEEKSEVKDASDKELFKINGTKYSGAYGVLLMDGIPETNRYIILAELLSRAK